MAQRAEKKWKQYPAEEHDDWEEEADLETFLAGSIGMCWTPMFLIHTWKKNAVLIRACTKPYLGYKEARDTLNQVRRGRGFWPVIAIPAPDGRSATLAVRNTDESFRGKGKDGKSTHKGKSKGSKSGKSGKSKGGKAKSSGKSSVKGKGDTLKQRLVSRTQSRLCGEEGHKEEDCPQADVDMPQAKRRVTFSRPSVGTSVSQAWGVETWTVAPSAESAETRLKMWTSQENLESTNLMGVTMTMS